MNEAKNAGILLRESGLKFDQIYTSVLKWAIQTYNILSDELNCMHLPVKWSWRLNERHYGAL